MRALALYLALFTNFTNVLWAIPIRREEIQFKNQHITLSHLNPDINRWLILESSGVPSWVYHIENPDPSNTLSLYPLGITITDRDGKIRNCALWGSNASLNDADFSQDKHPFAPICEKNLYLRLKRDSDTRLTWTEWGTKFFRQSGTGMGETIINSIKPLLVQLDKETAEEEEVSKKLGLDSPLPPLNTKGPKPAAMIQTDEVFVAAQHNLGFSLEALQIEYGKWYETSMHKGVFAGLFAPKYLGETDKSTSPLLDPEKDALIYLAAYDLSKFSVQFISGTTEPGVAVPPKTSKEEARLRKQIVPIGSIPPYKLEEAIGVFVGGFKVQHSTISDGPFKGRTYGAIENGVEIQKMSGGLATIFTDKTGDVKIANWPEEGDPEREKLEKSVVSARQNGVLILSDTEPGKLVADWRGGNWSASASGLRMTLRSGICITNDRSYLLFMAFNLATPSAMAKVMRAYDCDEGMALDMNALMYMHNAIYKLTEKEGIVVEYLDKEMLYPPDLKLHRFIMDNNYRDFFYVTRR